MNAILVDAISSLPITGYLGQVDEVLCLPVDLAPAGQKLLRKSVIFLSISVHWPSKIIIVLLIFTVFLNKQEFKDDFK